MNKVQSKFMATFIGLLAFAVVGCKDSLNSKEFKILYSNTKGIVNPNPCSYTGEEEIVLSDLVSTDEMSFLGWFSDIPNENGEYVLVKTIPAGSACDYSLHAKWRFKITYKNTSGYKNSNPDSYNGAYYIGEENDILLIDLPVDNTFRFVGWFDDLEGGNKIEKISAKNNAPLTLYARVWESNAYTIDELLQALEDDNVEDSVILRGEVPSYSLTEISRKMILKKRNLSLDLRHVSGITAIPSYAFENNTYLKEINLPNTITKIGLQAFHNCTGITAIRIPSSTKEIISNAFFGCTGLTSIIIPSSVIKVGTCAFHSCSNLTSVEIPSSLEKIEIGTFQCCTNLKSVKIAYGVKSIEGCAISCCPELSSIEIPASVTYIGTGAFSACTKLKDVIFVDTETVWYGKESSYNEGIAVNENINTLQKIGKMNSNNANATKLTTTYMDYNLCNELYFK